MTQVLHFKRSPCLLRFEFGYPTVLLPVGCLNSSLASSTRSRENRLMQINVTFDSSASLAPAGFVAAVNYVVNYFDQLFPNPVTFSIYVGYGEINGQALDPSALGESEQYLSTASYSSVRNALLAQNAPGASTLPASAPADNPGQLYISLAEATALGLAPNNGSLDGYVGFSSVSNIFSYSTTTAPPPSEYYFVGVVEHEFSEVMGRVSYLDSAGAYSPMDLLRYSAPGVHQFTTGAASYFSIDGGATNLDNWNNFQTGNSGDLGDWAPSAGNDAFNDNSSPGVINALTSTDTTLMNALGWGGINAGVGLPNAKVAVGDFNGDGKADIAMTGQRLGGIGSYLSNGDGTFHAVYSSQTGSDWVDWPSAKAITGDFNGDGKTDIAVTASGLGGIASYLSNGDGTFHAVYSSQTGSDWVDWPSAKAITGDFNGDGKTDIAVTASGLGGIASYLSNGDGTFHAAYSSQTGADWVDWPTANATTGDFNGDGKTDIAVTASGLGGIASYLSNGDGTFHAVYSSQTGSDWIDWSGAKATTGDFNGDGKTDIAVTAPGLGGLASYLSNGDGTFHAIFSP